MRVEIKNITMAPVFEGVQLCSLNDSGTIQSRTESLLRLEVTRGDKTTCVTLLNGTQMVYQFTVGSETDCCKAGKRAFIINVHNNSIMLVFQSEHDMSAFYNMVKFNKAIVSTTKKDSCSVFDNRTDESSAIQYFQFYGYLSQQQNMMQDYIRTSTYQRAMLQNSIDFQNKVVVDVGAGSGILSFFAIQAGAKKVYAIEASSIAQHCEVLVHHNKLTGKIIIVPGKVEEVKIPEPVDIIISEPMGYMLFNERMLESYIHARKWLKPGGNMFPTTGDLHIAPFTDDALYQEQFAKTNFWYQNSFYGVDLSSLREAAIYEYYRQPIVDTFDVRILVARSHKYTVDFTKAEEKDLHTIDIPVKFTLLSSGTVHGLAFWFDVAFKGSNQTIWLSTAPTEPLTHWYQVRCMLRSPIFAKAGQTLTGRVKLVSNSRQSYDIDIDLTVEETGITSSNSLDLKNPFFRYTGQAPNPPPGMHTTSPTESYWNTLQGTNNTTGPVSNSAATGAIMTNGLMVNDDGNNRGHLTTPSNSQYYALLTGNVNNVSGFEYDNYANGGSPMMNTYYNTAPLNNIT